MTPHHEELNPLHAPPTPTTIQAAWVAAVLRDVAIVIAVATYVVDTL